MENLPPACLNWRRAGGRGMAARASRGYGAPLPSPLALAHPALTSLSISYSLYSCLPTSLSSLPFYVSIFSLWHSYALYRY